MKKKNGFKTLTPIKKALNSYLKTIKPIKTTEKIKITKALDRAIAKDIKSPKNVPHYNRSAMDGYAVKAENTYGATNTSPIPLKMVEKNPNDMECVRVHTGSEIPSQTDAVIKIEDTEKTDQTIKTYKPVSPGENVSPIGEDVEKNEKILKAGHQLRPMELGLLRTLQIEEIEVMKKPETTIIPTGNEVIKPGQEPKPGQVIESNSITIEMLIERWGGKPKTHQITPDQPKKIQKAITKNLDKDIIVVIGGSSVGARDYTSQVIKQNGVVHIEGVAIKPGKPTILGEIEETPIIGLPGYPVAAAIAAKIFLKPTIQRKGKIKTKKEWRTKAKLTRKIHSTPGYQTYTRVKLKNGEATPLRTSGSGIITSITQADGIAIIPSESEGKDKGENVEVVPIE
ncbi:gephyrin-like molybdotransferase Glp [Methanonatronarchaeum sp. AMET-Sl]|uniref:molybdopterin molybdotransferase MoeA n=1 Tax=Methanonatronarchaeum sp. AMET-Sl TaxID=3037654 RepID=UPI00244D9CA1|nr:gephyrin-like molybdotransferase Glp [Methanonatronarchaeum sp. AMET-Sl]WGI17983.1 molybdopterin molybdotransferase MoeA [Methanonatronarchaeum sp. AMET-Sl]